MSGGANDASTLDGLRGRIVDLDAHLLLFPDTAEDILGPAPGGGPWRGLFDSSTVDQIRQSMLNEGLDPVSDGPVLQARREHARVDPWSVKEWAAHGAQIPADRVDALDRIGIRYQLLFSQFMETPLNTRGPEAFAALGRYNDYVIDWTKQTAGRVLPVCMLNTSNLESALAEARRVIDSGASGIQISGILPPGGLSPAAGEWDPLWAMAAEAGVPVVVHLGSTGGGSEPLINSSWFGPAHQLRPPPGDPDADDIKAPPFVLMTSHLYAEVTLTFMVLGGVFERHPGLRFGVIESGGSWVASWCERMDTLAASTSRYLSRQLSLKPSEYVRRQIRVAPFHFEPVASWIERSGLEEVYVFSSDYPHEEGGLNPLKSFHADLAPLGPDVVEKFFVTNGSLLLPGVNAGH